MVRRIATALSLLCVVSALPFARLRAAGPQVWRIEGARAFFEGDLTALSVDGLGRLRLGPAPRLLHDPAVPNAWSVARDAKGVLYVGTGNDGRIVRVDGTSGSVLFDSDELEAHAVAVGPDGRVYAGTSPDGAVYAIDAAGKATRFFDPEEKYIWALAFDRAGNLYVATGGEGKVYKVGRDGKGTAVLATSDTHVLSIALDARGRLYAGTAPGGRVYRLDEEGRAFVLLDSSFREIRALEPAEDGSFVYVAAVDGRAAEAAARPPAPAGQPSAPAGEVTVTESFSVVPPGGVAPVPMTGAAPEAAPGASTSPRGAVLRLRPDGDVDTLWTSTEDVPHSLAVVSGAVLVGTGDKGKVYRVRSAGEWTLVAALPAAQVTALARGAGDSAVVVTSNPARVYVLDAKAAATGTFVSKVKDAEAAARWGRVSWEGSLPPGTAVRLESRAGNTDRPDAMWTDWRAVPAGSGGDSGHADRARFFQIRLTLEQGKDGTSPVVETISAAYLQRNLPPEVKAITVHGPGEAFQKPISVSGDPEILGLDPDPVGDRVAAGRTPAGSPPAIAFSRKLYQRGLRTFSWQADDPNGDALSYDVFYRSVGEDRWRPLRSGLDEPVIAWDTTTVPNGRYALRVVASDAPANPPSLATTASRDSASFEVDNSPPTITASYDARARVVRATVRDDSPVRRLDFSLDGGRWEEVHPVDGIADSPEERYEVAVPTAAPGAGTRMIVLRATDILGNVSTLRVDVP
jgi:sugar lactone lactonase YvrE